MYNVTFEFPSTLSTVSHHTSAPFPSSSLFFLISKSSFLSFFTFSPASFHPPSFYLSFSPSMADSVSYAKQNFSHQGLHSTTQLKPVSKRSSKSYSNILCRSLFFVIFLLAIPLFPSQAPDFINQSVFTKFWEIVHLLFVGIAVSYGLFSRRNVDMDFEIETDNHSNDEDSQSSYVSRIFHVSPIFEDGYGNSCASDEKNVYQNWDSQYYRCESINDVDGSSIINEQSKTGLISSEGELQNSFEHDHNSDFQAWNSQYFQGESVVVLSQANCGLDEYGKPREAIGYKPLGLPVRSLILRNGNLDSPQCSNGSESGSSLSSSCSSSERSTISDRRFGDMGNINLEEKFSDNVGLPSQIPWRSRSVRMEMGETVGSIASRPLHFRPLSVDETQFESLKSSSFRSTTSFSSQASTMSYSPTTLSPSHSVSSELPNSETEDPGEKKSFRASYPPTSQSPATKVNGETRLNAFHLRRYSSGSLFHKESRGSLKDKVKKLGGIRRNNQLSSTETVQASLKLDKEPETLVKSSSRGKSVRTVRAKGYTAEVIKAGGTSKNHTGVELGKLLEEAKAEIMGKNEMKKGELGSISIGTNKKNLDTQSYIPKPTSEENPRRENEERSKNVKVDSEDDLDSETGNSKIRLDKDVAAEDPSDAGDDPHEVDKKAGEFIAKFREQIRLQKVASIERSKGKHNTSNYPR